MWSRIEELLGVAVLIIVFFVITYSFIYERRSDAACGEQRPTNDLYETTRIAKELIALSQVIGSSNPLQLKVIKIVGHRATFKRIKGLPLPLTFDENRIANEQGSYVDLWLRVFSQFNPAADQRVSVAFLESNGSIFKRGRGGTVNSCKQLIDF